MKRSTKAKYPEVEVFSDLRWAYDTFWRLSASRPEGMNGALRIPVSEINAWAQLHRLNHDQAIDLLTFIDAMDRAYMAHVKEVREEEEGKRPKNPTPGGQPKPAPKARPRR